MWECVEMAQGAGVHGIQVNLVGGEAGGELSGDGEEGRGAAGPRRADNAQVTFTQGVPGPVALPLVKGNISAPQRNRPS